MDFQLRAYQQEAVTATVRDVLQGAQAVANILPTGCLSGDTMIHTNRGGIGRSYTLRRLFNSMNGNPEKIRFLKQFRGDIVTYVRSFNGGGVGLHRVIGSVYSGVKDVYLLTLDNGRSIKGTVCHRVMTRRGWVPIGRLITDADEVMCDDMGFKGRELVKPKTVDVMVSNLWHHPFAPVTKTNKEKRGYTKRVEIHRAVYECVLNGISLEEYKRILRHDEVSASQLKFVDPSRFHIHHKDGNHFNNEPSNLESMPVDDHLEHHGDYSSFGQGIPFFSRVVSVTHEGLEDTYDIQCDDPHHNFVANGIVVHNSGKTECMAKTIEGILDARSGQSALVLSHLSLLTQQSRDRFRSRVPKLTVSTMQGKDRANPMSHVVVSTMQTARSEEHIARLKQNLVRPVGLLVVDETHMLPNASYEKIRDYFPNVPIIGYTATPFREKKLMTNFFDKISFTISLQELIDQGYLVPPVLRTFEQAIGEDFSNPEAMQVVTLYQIHEKGKKAIVFLREIEQAKLVCMLFESMGIKARAVTSEVTGDAREEIFDSYKNGDTDVLATVDVLTAGFDAPVVEAIFMPFGTKSPTQYLQRIGRGLRPFGDKKSCRIYMPGVAPKVTKKLYERINKIVLNAGRQKGFDRFTEELELTFYDKSAETYHWTAEVVKCIQKMEKLGMGVFARVMDEKQFPPQFMCKITELLARLPDKARTIPHGDKPATDSQKSILFEYGFNSQHLSMMNRNEASMMITAVLNRESDPNGRNQQFIVTEGRFKGRHVSHLPHKYRKVVVAKDPDGPISQMISQWNSRRKA